MECSHVKGCDLFVQFALNPALDLWKEHYCFGEHEQCVRYKLSKKGQSLPLTLLPNGKKLDLNRSQSDLGTTALFNCIEKQRIQMARSIFKTTSLDINARNVEGTTPLMASIESGSSEMVELMLEYNADKKIKNIHGQTAYDLAVEQGHDDLAKLIAES